ncbi:uncharacterized protein HMPREF1541_02853 [Cyphellophora europaea CBS 101466]|uniref:Uncharacterized protein n=1 Tax=Cyphellophora europaea (strain CBS 101466) TaxID=1220924 RepID=W2S6X6_CYPE1|nr:uncharacterized protein HMPREF1541_02853 [Cyphellophora europaea CBS 101466]ETN43694.1 hypothetical protein HMPREF1541_02853 [Cyphellophora europaea CBS 101466]
MNVLSIVYITNACLVRYESIKTQTVPVAKQSGQLGTGSNTVEGAPSSTGGEKTAENIRYGQNISESGMGGMTTTSTGEANQGGGYGGTDRDLKQEQQNSARTAQGHGPGSGVGA